MYPQVVCRCLGILLLGLGLLIGLASTAGAQTAPSPTANAGPDQTVVEGATVTLTASSSGFGPGPIYRWTSPRSIRLNPANNVARVTFIAPSNLVDDVILDFKLLIIGVPDGGNFDADTVTITVRAIIDKTIPVITLRGEAAVTTELGVPYDDPGATAIDDISGDITSAIKIKTFGATGPDMVGSSYTITYNVMDAAGNAAAEVTRTVTLTGPQTPTVTIGALAPGLLLTEREITGVEGGVTITLHGSGKDPDGDDAALSYAWTRVSDPTVVLAATPTLTFTTPPREIKQQVLTFRLRVSDADGRSEDAYASVTVLPIAANLRPIANAGLNQAVDEGATVTLDGSGSSDPDGDDAALLYLWTQTGGPDLQLMGAYSSTESNPSFTLRSDLPAGASLFFALVVTDAQGLASAAATVTVSAAVDILTTEVITTDGTTRTVTVARGAQTGDVVVVNAIPYSPDGETDGQVHEEIIAAADTTDPEVLGRIELQPRSGRVIDKVDLLEQAIIDITVDNSDSTCTVAAPCTVTLPYTQADLTTLGITEPTDLTIFHYTSSQWKELGGDVDTGTMTITAATSSFSPFALATVFTSEDTAPSFSDTISDQNYALDTAITALELPAANGGNGALTYSLTPLPDGLTFDAASRTLSGTPKVEGSTTLTWTVVDADANTDASDSATLTFTITVGLTDLTAERVKQLNEAIMSRLTQVMLGATQTAISSRIDSAFSETPHSASYQINGLQLDSQSTLSSTLQAALQKLPSTINALTEGNNINIDWRQMLANSSFALSLQDNASNHTSGNASALAGLSLWGSGDYSRLSGTDQDLDWGGDVLSIQLGADKRISDNLLLGGLVSWSDGDIDINFDDVEEQGSYQHQMTSIHPYIAWNNDTTQLWGSLGYGQGELEIELGRDQLSTDTRLLSLAGGIKGRLSQMLSLKSDISLARTDIDESDYSKQQHINSQRLRLLLEVDLLPIGHFMPTLEAGLRYDGGDGDSGIGAVVDATIGYTNLNVCCLTFEGRLHTFIGRDNYKEWGISGVIALPAADDGSGLAFSLSPSYGTGGSGAGALWRQNQGQQNQLGSQGFSRTRDYQPRLDARLSYGFANGTGSLLQPYSEMTYGASNRYRFGVQWQGNERFHVNLFGERHESKDTSAEHAILLQGRVQF